MRFLAFAVLCLSASALGEERNNGKRGAPSYATTATPVYETATPSANYAKVAAKLAQPLTYSQQAQQPQYLAQQYSAAQPQYQFAAQAAPAQVQYSQPALPQKVYAQAAPAPIQYSLASDVSSFTYNSPVVQYSNLGLLNQITPKNPAPAPAASPVAYQAPATYSASPAYSQAPVSYTPQAQAQLTYSAPAQVQKYSAAPVTYTQPQPQITYAPAPKQVYQSSAPQPQALAYQPQYQSATQYQSPVQYQPQYQTQYQPQASVRQVVYSAIPSQQRFTYEKPTYA